MPDTMVVRRTVTLTKTWCGVCGIDFAMPDWLYEKCREDSSEGFYCPKGHSLCFKESENDKLRKRIEREEARRKALLDQLEATERSLSAQKGQNTKLKKRASAGVCPCCNRQFQNVKLHIGRKHPEFVKEQGTKIEQHPAEVSA